MVAVAPDEPAITIGELAKLTGVTVATLRAWESRYGFPAPHRTSGGQRRYSHRDVEAVRQVLVARNAGLSLEGAIARGRQQPDATVTSVFAELRRHHPKLAVHSLSRRAMLSLSTAIEDECCARGEHPLLIAFFQRERHYRPRQARWQELARTARLALVLADFPQASAPPGQPVEIPLPVDTPLRREWALVCASATTTACLAGWERQTPQPGGDRRFEALWSVDPVVVADAAQLSLRAGRAQAPSLVPDLAIDEVIAPQGPQQILDASAALLARVVAMLDR